MTDGVWADAVAPGALQNRVVVPRRRALAFRTPSGRLRRPSSPLTRKGARDALHGLPLPAAAFSRIAAQYLVFQRLYVRVDERVAAEWRGFAIDRRFHLPDGRFEAGGVTGRKADFRHLAVERLERPARLLHALSHLIELHHLGHGGAPPLVVSRRDIIRIHQPRRSRPAGVAPRFLRRAAATIAFC